METKHKILIVDDEQVVLRATRRILTAEGYFVQTASDAESALTIMEQDKPDVALVDVKLPGLSGLEFLESVSKDFPRVVVIVTTGYATANYAIAALKGGAFDYLPKPFAFGELLSPIRRACEYLRLPDSERTSLSDLDRTGYYFLGMQAWVKPENGDTAVVGVTDVFQKTIGKVVELLPPRIGDQLRQGGLLARVSTERELVHVALSALSGRVLETNRELELDPTLINKDPMGAGWIARLSPVALEDELTPLRHNV